MSRLLVIDDEQSICWGLQQLGQSMGLQVETAASAEEGLVVAQNSKPDVVMIDVRLPGLDGLSAIADFRRLLGAVPIIVMTAYGSIEVAIQAARTDALEYIIKPFDLQTASRAISRGLQVGQQPAQIVSRSAPPGGGPFVGTSTAMQEVYRRIALASQADVNVMLTGESGTGKELAAREIHRHSLRSGKPFVAVNVASLNPALAESALFGHVRGAFTGAQQNQSGLLVEANGGTLFLDEIADIPRDVQVKLLRALEQGEVFPVGSAQPVATNFRIVSASHRDLLGCIERGEFRHDLYFRLSGFRIDLPALRTRPDDIPDLASHFLNQFRPPGDAGSFEFADDALKDLKTRHWPGNVRELRHAVEHAAIMARGGSIHARHFPVAVAVAMNGRSAETTDEIAAEVSGWIEKWTGEQLREGNTPENLHAVFLRLVEKPLLASVLEHHHGQVAAAARQLGLHRTTLRKRLVELGLMKDGEQ